MSFCSLRRRSRCKAARLEQRGLSCTGVAESRGEGGGRGRRGLVVGSVVGATALAGAAAVIAVVGTRAMASSGGGREAAVLASRYGMRLFSEWLVSAGGCEGVGGRVRQGDGARSSAETMCGQDL